MWRPIMNSKQKQLLIKSFLVEMAEKGVLVNPDALSLMISSSDLDGLLHLLRKIVLTKGCEIITAEMITSVEGHPRASRLEHKPKNRQRFLIYSHQLLEGSFTAKEWDGRVEIEVDPTLYINPGENPSDFVRLFQYRYNKIYNMLISKPGVTGVEPIENMLVPSRQRGKEVTLIGMVTSIRRGRKGHLIMDLEDPSGICRAVVSPEAKNASHLVLDQVVAIKGSILDSNAIYVREIIFPDVRRRTPPKLDVPVYIAFTSDLHIGSKAFLRKKFEGFIDWLHGRVQSEKERIISSRIKYLVITGDLVDGIGVYPGQQRELEVQDIEKQYRILVSYLLRIPNHITLIFIPGNHDATRLSEPQPAIDRAFLEPLIEEREVYVLGNPAIVRIDGLRVLLYHGKSLDNWNIALPREKRGKPEEAIEEMLRCRHLSPIYGQNVPLAPEERDFHVIEREPDILVTAHMHINGEKTYRGIFCIGSGTWQGKTSYQAEMNIEPTPGIVQIFDMKNHLIMRKSFV